MENIEPALSLLIENWEVVFVYLFKQLSDIKTELAIHRTEIKNLKA